MAATPLPASLAKPNMPVLQRGHPLAQGLVGAWLFTDGGAATTNAAGQQWSIRDWSDSLLTGLSTPSGANSIAMKWGDGLLGRTFLGAASDGASEARVEVTDTRFATLLQTNEFSFAGWVRDDAVSPSLEYILTCPAYNGTNEPLAFRVTSAGPRLEISTFAAGSPFTGFTSVFNPSAGVPVWFHFVISHSKKRGTIILYINGAFDSSASITGSFSFTNTNPFTIGGGGVAAGNARPWVGAIDSIMMWNRGLGADDVRLLYSDHYAMFRVPSFAPAFRTTPPVGLPLMGQIWLA